MKKYKKSQMYVIIFGFATLLGLGWMNISMNFSKDNTSNLSYKSSLDSVKFLNNRIKSYQTSNINFEKDIFNLTLPEKKKAVVKPKVEEIVPEVELTWVKDVIPYKMENLSMILFFQNKARLSVKGKTLTVSVGDFIPVGIQIEKEKDITNNIFTGNEREIGEYKAKILSINSRATYVDFIGGKALKLRPNINPEIIPKTLVPSAGAVEEDDSTDPRSGGSDDEPLIRRRR